MTFLPIVTRELRVAARRRSTYWVRSGAAVLVLLVAIWVYLLTQTESSKDIALVLFGILTCGAVLHCWSSGLRATADCLSQEKREGTFGLLFLTDLKGYDVVLGKLVASSMNSFYGVLAVVPMLAVPLLMGGVAPAEFGRMALVALDTLFLSLTLGLFASSVNRSARKALGATLLLLLLVTAGAPVAAAVLTQVKSISRAACLYWPSPGYAFAAAFDSLYATESYGFWMSLTVIFGLGFIALFLASVVAPRSWQDRPEGVRQIRWRELWQSVSFGGLRERQAFRRRLLSRNAFFWLAARARLKPAVVWVTLGLIACGWAWCAAKWRHEWLNETIYFLTALLLNGLLKVWVAGEAGHQLAEDRRTGALELLLSTPISVQDILRGQRLALQRQFLGPLVVVLLCFGLFLAASLPSASDPDERSLDLWLYGGGSLLLVADLAALHWTGMWQALVARNPNRFATGTVLRILILPWAVYALVLLFAVLLWASRNSEPSPRFFLGLWIGLSLAADLGFGLWSRHKLLSSFRAVAERRYSSGPGFWRRLLGA